MKGLSGLFWFGVGLFFSCAAQAGDAKCMWNLLPAASKDEIIVAYANGGSDAVTRVKLPNVFSPPCIPPNVTSANASAVGEKMGIALQGYSMEMAVTDFLARKRNVPPGKLDNAWRALSPKERYAIRNYLTSDSIESGQAIIHAVQLAGVTLTPDDPKALAELELYLPYFASRAMREDAEAGF